MHQGNCIAESQENGYQNRGGNEEILHLANQTSVPKYRLNRQVGHLLRKANQRHTGIFAEHMPAGLTPTRFAALVKLYEVGATSQNELGRLTAMDVATIKGVVDRLRTRGLVESRKDKDDARRRLVSLTDTGRTLIEEAIPLALHVTQRTTETLSKEETKLLDDLLEKIS